MMIEKKEILFVFRKKNPLFFSIENVFETLMKEVAASGLSVRKVESPFFSTGILALLKNIIHLRKHKAAVVHITGDVHYAVFAFPRKKTVLTVHDCVFVHQAKGFKKWVMTKLFLTWPVNYARVVTTISEDSKREIIQFSNCDPSKVKVIPDPYGTHIKYLPKTFNSSKPRLLFIGSTPNKNLPRVIKAITGLNCHLELVARLQPEQVEALQKAGISFSICERLSDEELNQKFHEADILLFPTLFEGFGLPILEAQQAGKPVITSNIGPMNWVAGNAACLVDPYSEESIRQGLQKVIENEQFRATLVTDGFENLQRFSPSAIMEQYLKLYKELII